MAVAYSVFPHDELWSCPTQVGGYDEMGSSRARLGSKEWGVIVGTNLERGSNVGQAQVKVAQHDRRPINTRTTSNAADVLDYGVIQLSALRSRMGIISIVDAVYRIRPLQVGDHGSGVIIVVYLERWLVSITKKKH